MIRARFFSAGDWRTAVIAVLLTLTAFTLTLAPTVTMEYSGALVVAADHLGVARPPGYPIWTLMAKGFICLFPHSSYHGHPNPAWAVNFMSAVLGALSCGLLALLVSRLSRELAPLHPPSPLLSAVAGIVSALLFAFSPVMWTQSVIAETHTLTTCYFLLLLTVSLYWMSSGHAQTAYLSTFLFGLGLSISPMLLTYAPLLLLSAAFVSRKTLARMATAVLIFLGFLVAEFRWGRLNPSHATLILGCTLFIALLFAAFRPTRSVAVQLTILLAGLVPYLYLPLASAHNPPVNMGQACTWAGFWHVVCRGQYETMNLANPLLEPLPFVRQVLWYLRLATAQFTIPLAALALIPALGLPWMPRHARKPIGFILAALFCFSIVVLVGANPQLDIQNTFITRVLFMPSFALLALLCGLGLGMLLHAFSSNRPCHPPPESAETKSQGPAITIN